MNYGDLEASGSGLMNVLSHRLTRKTEEKHECFTRKFPDRKSKLRPSGHQTIRWQRKTRERGRDKRISDEASGKKTKEVEEIICFERRRKKGSEIQSE